MFKKSIQTVQKHFVCCSQKEVGILPLFDFQWTAKKMKRGPFNIPLQQEAPLISAQLFSLYKRKDPIQYRHVCLFRESYELWIFHRRLITLLSLKFFHIFKEFYDSFAFESFHTVIEVFQEYMGCLQEITASFLLLCCKIQQLKVGHFDLTDMGIERKEKQMKMIKTGREAELKRQEWRRETGRVHLTSTMADSE